MKKNTNREQPDVSLYYSYSKEEGEKIHLRIVSMADNGAFPHGIGLEYTFTGEKRKELADAWAAAVQKRLDQFCKDIIKDYKDKQRQRRCKRKKTTKTEAYERL